MTSLLQLTAADIRRWTGDTSFARSRSYVHGAILHPRRAGATLKAQCAGSAPQPYHVEATLGETGVASAFCSCPIGDDGHCKHVAALLQTWLADPDAFVEVEDVDAVLERRSKAELIALLRRMVERYPDLEMLLELPLPQDTQGAPVDSARIQRQVAQAFGGYDEYWGGVAVSVIALDQEADDETFLRICRDTHRLGDLVTRLLERGRVDEAVAVLPNTHVVELLQLADIFVQHKQAEHAERVVAQRAEHDHRLPEWLKERARARGDLRQALTLSDTLFWARPTLPGYAELKALAEPLGLWNAARPKLMARLAEKGQFPLLTEIHLAEDEIDQALETVQTSRYACCRRFMVRPTVPKRHAAGACGPSRRSRPPTSCP